MMTNGECRIALKAHIEAERARDLEAILDSLHDDCCYLVTGWELRGKPALRVMYERARPSLTDENMDEYLRAIDDPAVADWGPEHVVLRYTSEYPVHYGMIVITRFRDGKVLAEDTFYSVATSDDPQAFAGVPGASRIEPGPASNARRRQGGA
ncbi:MAG: nuclear transport factor 2 family protein [Caulobacteraceae bacterium]|nr:nuclear transport factor 2 family protein [Caulobacteraceae bacterium]